MEQNQEYILNALELHLFFARIMKEHSLFLKVGFLPPDAPFSALEVTVGLPLPHKGIPDHLFQLHSSDAHYL